MRATGRSDNEAGGTPILCGMKGYGGRAGAGAGARRAVASVAKPVRISAAPTTPVEAAAFLAS